MAKGKRRQFMAATIFFAWGEKCLVTAVAQNGYFDPSVSPAQQLINALVATTHVVYMAIIQR